MSDPVSSMDVEDVLSSIRRLVSEEAKTSGSSAGHDDRNGREGADEARPPSPDPVDIYEAAENAADAAMGDILRTTPNVFDPAVAGLPPSNDFTPEEAADHAAHAPDLTPDPFAAPRDAVADDPLDRPLDRPLDAEDPQMSFRHQAAAAARRGEEQKLVLTAALRVANPVIDRPSTFAEVKDSPETWPGQDAGLPETAADNLLVPPTPEAENTDAVVADLRPPRPLRPHLRPVDEISPSRMPRDVERPDPTAANSRPHPFDYAPDDTLFDRAKQAMAKVGADHPAATIPDAGQTRPEAVLADGPDGRGTGLGPNNPFRPVENSPAKPPIDRPQEPATDLRPDPAPSDPPQIAEAAAPATSPFRAGEGAINVADTADSDEPSTINFAEEEESILDEETLRDMVSEMVREELQGELGDRITRNVRKLVRREIQRAIASREFE